MYRPVNATARSSQSEGRGSPARHGGAFVEADSTRARGGQFASTASESVPVYVRSTAKLAFESVGAELLTRAPRSEAECTVTTTHVCPARDTDRPAPEGRRPVTI